MKSAEIRERFLAFFERHGHQRVASSSLIPANDPTLLFANAGMNQFKDAFLGREDRGYRTACSSQKCVRAGGKHNDLENVGYTARHHTFFEMLGNFSFGDYFKEEAIELSWQFLTVDLGIPTDRLYVTVFRDDDEAFAIWRDKVGVPADRIFRFDEKDNFWSMGDTGPCGPCSEIFYDYREMVPGPADPFEAIESGSDKVVEIWNLVFMQFDRDEKGDLNPLPNPSIDTGMGLERIASVMQGVSSNYQTDLFQDIMNPVAANLGLEMGREASVDAALRVIADHLRAMTFLIADGVRPSNEGRGYVLRRIMRRAMVFGKNVGQEGPFLHRQVGVVVDKMKDIYPNLDQERPQIQLLVEVEEKQFERTIRNGLPVLEKYLDRFVAEGREQVPGDVMYHIYETFGFPIDLMEDVARDRKLGLDHAGYREVLAAQGSDAKKPAQAKVHPQLLADAERFETEMTCHAGLKGSGTLKRILVGDAPVEDLEAGHEAVLVLDRTSFYAESGGQIGDRGMIRGGDAVFEVEETTKVLDKLVLHKGKLVEGRLAIGAELSTEVDPAFRRDTMKNHTATHLLHQALREVLGLHVRQAGSLVDPEKLRFDFNHFAPMTNEEIEWVEDLVNREILADTRVATAVMAQQDAMESGAIAFFGDKYGDTVRVVSVGDYSKEFCGGTHVGATGEIGCLKIVSERGLASGVRRLIALTGPRAFQRFRESETLLREAGDRFFLKRDQFLSGLERMVEEKRALEQKVEELKMKLAKGGASDERTESVGDFKVLIKRVSEVSGGQLRQLSDELLQRIKDGVVLLAAEADGKAQLLVKTNRKDVHAGNLVREMAALVGGKGGGRPDMAMAGGKDTGKIDEALEKGLSLLRA
ncbi:Alanine--tRNA ligase [Sulfidibacter corallicola]|uniref:Alanine--tRNA ligase n=1 Tax=Sulfidibacter corallicola TaxID=2818388 RepID=A0A8A4TUD1_SULCO|nr:alanine--tRNA ligase [Sulfidibacter corallicola]QTD52738.1 alanine--tRNA ligase [Sulfidibacter corallicola]